MTGDHLTASAGTRAWLVAAFGEERQYAGNIGYSDDVQSAYRYDSLVPNSKQIRVGDLLILRDKGSVLGVARILEIEVVPGSKHQRLCPRCKRSGIKERANKHPRFRCHGCKTEFEVPLPRETEVTNYVARFGGAFEKTSVKAGAKDFRVACPRYNGQHAMQAIDLDKLGSLGNPIRLVADKVLGINGDRALAEVASTPTADPDELARRVGKLRELGLEGRPEGQPSPKKVSGAIRMFVRDPRVVFWVLQNARGGCEACLNPGPFECDKGVPFLEVHHIVPLAEQGPDTIDNAVALCPNCHRAMHLARDRDVRRESLRKVGAAHAGLGDGPRVE